MTSSRRNPAIPFLLTFVLTVLLHTPNQTYATTLLHPVPPTGSATLHGRTTTHPPPNAFEPPHILEFTAHLTAPVLLYTELLQQFQTSLQACWASPDTATAFAALASPTAPLDPSDFPAGAVLVVDADVWNDACGTLDTHPLPDVDDEDDDLFFKITAAYTALRNVAYLQLSIVSGRAVVPRVDITITDTIPSATEFTPGHSIEIDDTAPTTPAQPDFAQTSTHTSSHQFDHTFLTIDRTLNPLPGTTVTLNGGLHARLHDLTFLRQPKTQLQWRQRLHGTLNVTITAKSTVSTHTHEPPIYTATLPGTTFSARIPFIGRLSLTMPLSISLQATLQLSTAQTAARLNTAIDLRHTSAATLLPPGYTVQREAAPGVGENGVGASVGWVDVGDDGTQIGGRATGEFSIRPRVGVSLSVGERGVAGMVGVGVGARMEVVGRLPPFAAVDEVGGGGGGAVVGACGVCHAVEGRVALFLRRFAVEMVQDGKVVNEVVLAEGGELGVVTVCSLPVTCAATVR